MGTVLSTTLIALGVIIGATFAVCFHVLDSSQYLYLVGAFAGAAGAVHVTGVGTTSSSSSPSPSGSPTSAGA